MKNKHKFLTTLLVVILCVAMAVSLIACDQNNNNEQEEVKDTSEFITNGNFEVTTSDIFPKMPSGWSGTAGSTASGNETEVDEDSLSAGVIDTDKAVYDKEKKKWNRLANPGTVGKDSNILMIYNKTKNSYKYSSNSFTLDADKIFRIDVSVKTVNLTDESHGAYIKIGGDGFVEFDEIKTNGKWETYSAMIKTSNVSSNSLNVVLSNGREGKNNDMLSEGYAFFDNIVVTEVVDTKDKTAEQIYNDFESKLTNNQNVDDLTLGDYTFKNISGSTNPFSSRKWTGVSSVGSDGETAPTNSDYIEKGIIDFNSKGIPTIASDVKPFGKDSKVLMINNKQATAYGYRSDSRIRIAASGDNTDLYYKLNVMVLTKDIEGKGAYIRLKSSTDKEEEIFTLDNIVSDSEWTKQSIFIKPDSNRNKDIYIQLGLGTGGKNDTADLVKGQVFFDEISLESVTEADYIAAEAKVSLESSLGGDLIVNNAYDTTNYAAGNYAKNDGITVRGELIGNDNSITVKNINSTITRFKYDFPLVIAPNNHYRLSMNVKTDILDDAKGINVLLYEKVTANYANNGKDKELTKIEKFNTQNIKKNVLADGTVELVFLIQGDAKVEKMVYFEFVLGDGTNLTPNTLVKGSATISEIELHKINFADYNSESGDQVKKHSFRADDGSIKNNDFNLTDITATKSQLDKIAENDEAKFDEEDYLDKNNKGIFGLPLNWTTSTKDQLSKLNAGIFDINNAAQLSSLGISSVILPENIKKGNSNLLAIGTKNEEQKPWGFTSPSLSLSKGKYYELSVWANLVAGNSATINLKSSSKSTIKSFDIVGNNGWTEYKFYINAGFDDFTAYLELKLGSNDNDVEIEGVALFDLPQLITVDKAQFEHVENITADGTALNLSTITFTTTTFDNATVNEDNEGLDTPTNWEGKHEDSDAPAGEYKSVAGVYNRTHGSRNWFGGENGKDKAPISVEKLNSIMDSAPRFTVDNAGVETEIIDGVNNNNVLVINNNVASEYVYSTTLAENSLTENKFYEISLYVLTYDLAKDTTATITLKLHNSTFVFSKDETTGENVNTAEKWVRYSFFISTQDKADIDNVQLSVALGTKGEDNYVSGYLFVDNVSISEISEARFDAKVPADKFPSEDNDKYDTKFSATNKRIVFTEDDLKKEAEEEEPEKTTDPLLWLYITSGVIGGLIVIVVVIFLLQKFHVFDKFKAKKSNFKEKGKETYNRSNVNANKSASNSKDINKKHQD